jgi:hypothetical protein
MRPARVGIEVFFSMHSSWNSIVLDGVASPFGGHLETEEGDGPIFGAHCCRNSMKKNLKNCQVDNLVKIAHFHFWKSEFQGEATTDEQK